VPRIERQAQVTWEGSSARGRGAIWAASSGAFAGLPYSEPSRVGSPDGETSPEELLAAAHAGCFAMSLAAELTRARTPPERLEVTATCVMDEVEGAGHRVVAMDIAVRGRADGSDGGAFQRAVEAAHDGCPVSALVGASAEVRINATFEGGT
jgi:osmotically inducible protein OsmC